jgi:hypothetical protein
VQGLSNQKDEPQQTALQEKLQVRKLLFCLGRSYLHSIYLMTLSDTGQKIGAIWRLHTFEAESSSLCTVNHSR